MFIPHLKNTHSHHKSHHFFRLIFRLNRAKSEVRSMILFPNRH